MKLQNTFFLKYSLMKLQYTYKIVFKIFNIETRSH